MKVDLLLGPENILFADVCVCLCALFSLKTLQAGARRGLNTKLYCTIPFPDVLLLGQLSKNLSKQLDGTVWTSAFSALELEVAQFISLN